MAVLSLRYIDDYCRHRGRSVLLYSHCIHGHLFCLSAMYYRRAGGPNALLLCSFRQPRQYVHYAAFGTVINFD